MPRHRAEALAAEANYEEVYLGDQLRMMREVGEVSDRVKMMNCALKTRDCALKTRNFVLKMMDFAGSGRLSGVNARGMMHSQ